MILALLALLAACTGGEAPSETGAGSASGADPVDAVPEPARIDAAARQPGVPEALESRRGVPGCLVFTGPPQPLSPPDGPTAHHPSLARRPDGTVLVAWQVGKRRSHVAVRSFDDRLAPTGDPLRLSALTDARATHPQLVVQGPRAALLWTNDPTDALRVRALSPQGGPAGPIRDLVPDGAPRPGLYADGAFTPDGTLYAVAYRDEQPRPGWTALATDPTDADAPIRTAELPTEPTTKLGGPPTIRRAEDGVLWVAWPEQLPDGTRRSTRLHLGRLAPDDLSIDRVRVVATAPERFERPALALSERHELLIAWTAYPFAQGGWGAWWRPLSTDGEPTGVEAQRLDAGGGRMTELDAILDVGVLAWEDPRDGTRDLVLQVFDAREPATPRCGPIRAHAADEHEQARAQVALWPSPQGGVDGAVVWHSSTRTPRVQAVWGRRFYVPLPE